MDWRSVLWDEFCEGEEGTFESTFLFCLRAYGRWDRDAYHRITEAMAACCRATQDKEQLERWLVRGFHATEDMARGWIEPPKSRYAEDHEDDYQEIYNLNWWFMSGSPAGKFAVPAQLELPLETDDGQS